MFPRIDMTLRLLIAVLFVFWIVWCFIGYYLFIRPQVARYNRFNIKITAARQALVLQNQHQSKIKSDCKQLANLIVNLKLKMRHFPKSDDLSARVQSITHIIVDSGLTLEQFTPIAFNQQTKINKLSFNLEMTGSYAHFVRFLNRWSQKPGLVMIQYVLITQGIEEQSKLKFQLVISLVSRSNSINQWRYERFCTPSGIKAMGSLVPKHAKRDLSLKHVTKNMFINNSERDQKNPLEQYPVAELKYVGVMKSEDRIIALVQLPDKSVRSVMTGQGLGNNHGVVRHITKRGLQIVDSDQGTTSLYFYK